MTTSSLILQIDWESVLLEDLIISAMHIKFMVVSKTLDREQACLSCRSYTRNKSIYHDVVINAIINNFFIHFIFILNSNKKVNVCWCHQCKKILRYSGMYYFHEVADQHTYELIERFFKWWTISYLLYNCVYIIPWTLYICINKINIHVPSCFTQLINLKNDKITHINSYAFICYCKLSIYMRDF